LQPVLNLVFGQGSQFKRREVVAVQRDPDNGLRVGFLFSNDWLVNVLGQFAAHASDAITHVLRGDVDVAIEVKLDGSVTSVSITAALAPR
jgi:hypothetical protein